jgi:hypothetical protein
MTSKAKANSFGGSLSNISLNIKIARQNRKHFRQQEPLHYKDAIAAAVYSPTPFNFNKSI